MPFPAWTDQRLAATYPTMSVELEPAASALDSLTMLNVAHEVSGLGEWVMRTTAALPPDRARLNRLVLQGLFFVIVPQRRWQSFAAYLEHLAQTDPTVLRDRLLAEVLQRGGAGPLTDDKRTTLLASAEAYLGFLRERLPDEQADHEIEAAAHTLLNRPADMRDLIVSHLQTMWDDYIGAEWERIAPRLRASVEALNRIPLAGLTAIEGVRAITGHELLGERQQIIGDATEIIFVPSVHVGPYLNPFIHGKTRWIIFGARLPGVHAASADRMGDDLSRSELLVRLAALGDDTRLRVLALLANHGELCAPEVMTHLGLTQSATSRHLRQLSANGYVVERRREGAKCYTLNPARIAETARALERFVLPDHA